MKKNKKGKTKKQSIYADVPKEFINAPIFASTPQKRPREVIINN